jgi:enamine deaminase RidA (YjgF/YER057c/UK114 family)
MSMREFIRTNPLGLPVVPGSSQIAEASGRLAFISGQVAVTKDDTPVGRDDFVAQLEQTFRNLDIAVRGVGGTFEDIVKLNYFCLDSVDRALLTEVRRVRDGYVSADYAPASTFVFVSGLVRKGWLIEIEAVASFPNAVR